jgi:hypothetical protein
MLDDLAKTLEQSRRTQRRYLRDSWVKDTWLGDFLRLDEPDEPSAPPLTPALWPGSGSPPPVTVVSEPDAAAPPRDGPRRERETMTNATQNTVNKIAGALPLPAVVRLALGYFDQSTTARPSSPALVQRAAAGLSAGDAGRFRSIVDLAHSAFLATYPARLRVAVALARVDGVRRELDALAEARELARALLLVYPDSPEGATPDQAERRGVLLARWREQRADLDGRWTEARTELAKLEEDDPIGEYRELLARLEAALAEVGLDAGEVPASLREPIELASTTRELADAGAKLADMEEQGGA